MRKEIQVIRKKVDAINKELKPLGHICQKKVTNLVDSNKILGWIHKVVIFFLKQEREYKETLEAFNEKDNEKVHLLNKLMEVSDYIYIVLFISIVNDSAVEIF